MRAIGARTGRAAEAARVAAGIEGRIDAIRGRVSGLPRPRTLVVFARDRLALRNIYASGGVGFVNDMLEAAGGENVFADVRQQAVQATSELVLARAPDVILELRGDFESIPVEDRNRERHVWDALSSVPAVRNGRIDILVSSSLVVPGPRVADGVELIRARAASGGVQVSRVLVSWSSGKDSAWMVRVLRATAGVEIAGLLTSFNADADRVSMHAVRRALVEAQAGALGLPLTAVELPYPCSNEIYEARMREAVAAAVAAGCTHVAFGDLFLEDVRRYREERLTGSGLAPLFPLWGRPTPALAREMVAGGLRATLTCVDPRQLDASFAGRPFDAALLDALPPSADPCGERGEFHTFAWDGPMFGRPVPVVPGEVVVRDGFVFQDLTTAAAS